MATYYTDRTETGTAGNTTTVIPPRVDGRGLIAQSCEITVGTALANNDIIELFKVPLGAVVIDLMVSSDGTQGANNDAVFTVGDGDDTDRYITTAGGLALRTGGGLNRMNAHTGLHNKYTADDTIDLKVTTAGTGQTTGGKIRAHVVYSMGY